MGQAVSAASSSSRRGSQPPVPQASIPTKAKHHDAELVRDFRHFDADGDGRISASEIQELCGCTAAEADKMVAAVDSDGDGFISIEEFGALLEGGESETLRMAFAEFDENGDGFITPEELRRAPRRRLGDNNLTVEQCSEMVAKYDENGDGAISLDEFKAMMAPKSS